MSRYCRRRLLVAGIAAMIPNRIVDRVAAWAGGPAQAASVFRFAICNEIFKDWPLDKAFGLAAECGYTGIEIAPFTIANHVTEVSAAKRAEVRRQAEKAGLEVVGLHWLLAKTEGFHLTSPDPAVRRKTAQYLGELARFCADLGGKLLVFGSPQQRNVAPGISRNQALQYAREVFEAALATLEKIGVVLAVEPLAPTTTNFINTAADAVELIRRIGSPYCRLQLDCLAMASERTPIPQLIRQHRAWLVHFHANDPNGQGPGFGKLDFVPILRALREIDYRGWVSVEVFDERPGAEQIARQSIAYLRNCSPKA